MSRRPPCGRPVVGSGPCAYERLKGKQQCVWHYAAKQPAHIQKQFAGQRLADAIVAQGGPEKFERRERVPAAEWPEGERWCSGCQSFVPLFYVSGSRCRSCNSEAAHAARVEKVYGISKEEYERLFTQQGGRCFICQRSSSSRRLAVDHDHDTGKVRGLLCPDPDRGCNHAILGNIKDVAMARRILLYLAQTPYDQMLGGERRLSWAEYCAQEVQRAALAAQEVSERPPGPKPPF